MRLTTTTTTKTARELQTICSRILRRAGASGQVADRVARHLVGSELVGVSSHGVMRLADYVSWLQNGKVAGDDKLEILRSRGGAVCVMDAHFTFGPYAAWRAG